MSQKGQDHFQRAGGDTGARAGGAGGEVETAIVLAHGQNAAQMPVREEDGPDYQVIEIWLAGRGGHTQRAYRKDIDRFFKFARKPLAAVDFRDLQLYAAALEVSHLAPASRARALAAVKSLFSFALKIGFLKRDVARVLKLPRGKGRLAERILEPADVRLMILKEDDGRNRLMLLLLYHAGVRVSELVGLRRRDLQPHGQSGQITVFGKGDKTRSIRLEAPLWKRLSDHVTQDLKANPNLGQLGAGASDVPVFHPAGSARMLDPSQIWRIVRAAAQRAGIEKPVSAHWLRHCHASHALDGGAPISLVQQTLGHSSIATTSRYLHARPDQSSGKFLPGTEDL